MPLGSQSGPDSKQKCLMFDHDSQALYIVSIGTGHSLPYEFTLQTSFLKKVVYSNFFTLNEFYKSFVVLPTHFPASVHLLLKENKNKSS